MATIDFHKRQCKLQNKFNNPDNLTLMQIQHNYAVGLGYRSWSDLRQHCL